MAQGVRCPGRSPNRRIGRDVERLRLVVPASAGRRGPGRRRRVLGSDAARPGVAAPPVRRGPDLRLLPRGAPGGRGTGANADPGQAHPAGDSGPPPRPGRPADLHAGLPGRAHVRRSRGHPGLRVPGQADRSLPVVPAPLGCRGDRGGPRPPGAGDRPGGPHLRLRLRGRCGRHRSHLRPPPPAPRVLGAGRLPSPGRAGPDPDLADPEDVGLDPLGARGLARWGRSEPEPGAAHRAASPGRDARPGRRLAPGALHPGRDGRPLRRRARPLRELRGLRRRGPSSGAAPSRRPSGPPGCRPQHRAHRARGPAGTEPRLRPLHPVRSRPDPLGPVPPGGGRDQRGRRDSRVLRTGPHPRHRAPGTGPAAGCRRADAAVAVHRPGTAEPRRRAPGPGAQRGLGRAGSASSPPARTSTST